MVNRTHFQKRKRNLPYQNMIFLLKERHHKSIDIMVFNGSSIGQRFKCHICDGSDCLYSGICYNSVTVISLILLYKRHYIKGYQKKLNIFLNIQQCWKSKVRQLDGTESVSRGFTSSIGQMLLICNRQMSLCVVQSNNKKRHVSGSL